MAHISGSEVEGVLYSYDSESRNPLGLDAKMRMWAGALVYDKNTRAPTRILKDVEAPAPGPVAQKPKTPTISFSVASQAGTSTVVTLACATAGAEIYYTTNGSAPSKSSNAYTAPFELTADATIKAIAYFDFEDGNGERASSVASAQWKKKVEVTPPPSNDFTVYYGSIYSDDTHDNAEAYFSAGGIGNISDTDFADMAANGDTHTLQASTLRNLEINVKTAARDDAYMWKYVAVPAAKVPSGFQIVEKQTKGPQVPLLRRDVEIGGVEYAVFYGFTDADNLNIILDYHE